jgi:hypothetical protein
MESATMKATRQITFLDRLPPGWFTLAVMKAAFSGRKWDWCAFIIDVDPDEFKRDGFYKAPQEAWVRIPGKHRSLDDAWDAWDDMLATRH